MPVQASVAVGVPKDGVAGHSIVPPFGTNVNDGVVERILYVSEQVDEQVPLVSVSDTV